MRKPGKCLGGGQRDYIVKNNAEDEKENAAFQQSTQRNEKSMKNCGGYSMFVQITDICTCSSVQNFTNL